MNEETGAAGVRKLNTAFVSAQKEPQLVTVALSNICSYRKNPEDMFVRLFIINYIAKLSCFNKSMYSGHHSEGWENFIFSST